MQLVESPIETAEVLRRVRDERCGAAPAFLGTARRFTGTAETERLRYEAYRAMAEASLRDLAGQAIDRWPIFRCAIVHRLGDVPIGEASVAIGVASPHRQDAFAAGQWLIDTLKRKVPIWKQEHYRDGRAEWVHPAAGACGPAAEPPRGEADA